VASTAQLTLPSVSDCETVPPAAAVKRLPGEMVTGASVGWSSGGGGSAGEAGLTRSATPIHPSPGRMGGAWSRKYLPQKQAAQRTA